MRKIALREAAQDEIMQALANAILVMEERGPYGGDGTPNQELADEMRKLAAWIGKKFGYTKWAGIL